MTLDDMVDVGKCSHPIIRFDGVWNDFEGEDNVPQYTCMKPPKTNFRDVCCGSSFVPYVYGGTIAPEQYKELGTYDGKKYYYKDPKENMNPMRNPI